MNRNLLSTLAVSTFVLMLFASAAHGAAYTVNSAADTTDGTCDAANCTFREAIGAVNADGSGSISFAIGSGPATIDILTVMPAITVPVMLDATTQPGFAGTPIIRLRSTPKVSAAITITAGDTTVRGFDIGDVGRGIQVIPATHVSNVAIERNFIAVDPTAPLTSPMTSILVQPQGNGGSVSNLSIGNADPSGRNVLGGLQGIFFNGNIGGVIAGNFVGIGDDGSTPLALPFNSSSFTTLIQLSNITRNIVVGGSTPGARNVISSGPGNGILVIAVSVPVLIEGNYIGLDASGSAPRPNGLAGIRLAGPSSTTVANNVIVGGAGGTGVNVDVGSSNCTLRGNFIGTDATGNNVLATGTPVRIRDSSFITVGGTSSADRNIINGGSDSQIEVSGFCDRVAILGNSIGATLAGAAGSSSNYGVKILTNYSPSHPIDRPITIGGSAPGAGNVIAGSTGAAINIETFNTVTVQGNRIGINPAGTAALPTSGYGIRMVADLNGRAGSHVIGGAASGEGNTISGIQVNGANTGYGIAVFAGPPAILGNRIGTDSAGNASIANAGGGILVNGTGTTAATIGGTGAGAGNLISSNPIGINVLSDSSATILGNRIGTNAAGNAALGNGTGIRTNLNAGSTGSIAIGGATAGAGNLVSGNSTGISVTSGGTISIAGNRIGTNAAGTAALANDQSNIQVTDATVVIGGTSAGARNLVSGAFHGAGILLSALAGTTNATITGNSIGTDITGSAGIPNGAGGIVCGSGNVVATINGNLISGNSIAVSPCTATIRGNFIGTNATGTAPIAGGSAANGIVIGGGSRVGGIAPGEGNVIAYHTGAAILQLSGTGTSYLGNSIHDNGGIAIDLAPIGVTANDGGDADSGANNLQNFPALISAVGSGGGTTVSGSLSSTASTVFVIEIFSNSTADPSGFGEAQTFLGRTSVLTDASGNGVFNVTMPPVAAGHSISATATNQTTNDTSELSANVIVGAPGTFQFSAATTSVGEGASNVTLTVTRTGGSLPATIDYTTSNGTALAGSDYTATGGTLSFASADTAKTIVIPITSDTIDEVDETFSVMLSNAGGATIGAPSTEVVTITDDDPLPAIQVADAIVSEGNSGTTTLTFQISLGAPSAKIATIDYTTGDQTAHAGSDYGARFGTLTFAPGETLKTVAVTVNGDATAEADETMQLLLGNPSNAAIGDGEGIGTIANDDGPPAISIADVTVIEGNSGTSTATLAIVLTNPSSSIVTVDWATSGNTANSGGDFASGSGTVTFGPGDLAETITVAITGDPSVEGNESLFVGLTNPANGTIADAQATVTIADDDGTPSLTISNIAVDENAGAATLTVLLAPSSAQTVTVNASTSAGTAAAGADYTTTQSVLTFSAGSTSQTVAVPIASDLVSEGAESFSVTLDTPVHAAIANGTATATIVDDDPTPQLTITDANVIEGNAGTTPAAFTVSLSHASASMITVNWTALAGSASSATDFAAAGGSLTFLAGETSRPVTVSVHGDTNDEADETFVVTLSSPSNATIAKAQGAATIADDDGTPSLVVGDATLVEGNAGSSDLVFTITLAGATAQTVTVNYASANGTAVAGSDYAAGSGTLTFPSGTTTHQVHVAVIGDASVEADETLFVNLSGALNATISDNQATGTIENDDTAAPVPSISITDATLAEGNGGTANATFTVSLSVATTNAVTVQYATANGSAMAGSDYAAASGTVHFAPGVTSQIITVAVAGDVAVEPDETFTIGLSNPTNATIAGSQAAGLIVNDDSPAVVPSIGIQDRTVTEGNSGTTAATFSVTLSAATTNTVTVGYATANGSATAGSDYAAISGTLVFAPGVTSQSIIVAVAGDTSVEPDETFALTLSNPTNATLPATQAAGLIVNDDSPAVVPSISIQDRTVAEGDSGTTAATFSVTLSAATTNTITVDFATANGSATAGSDYAAMSGTLVFAPGATSQSIIVAVAGDASVEPDETFTIALSNPTNATLADAQAAGLIVNDDSAASVPSITIQNATVDEGDSGTTAATFLVALSAPTTNAVTVNYATADGSASAGSDYAATSGTLVFAPGVTSQVISVAVAGDLSVEPNETFTLQLSNPGNATPANIQATGTINNDDVASSTPSIGISDMNVGEGDEGTRNGTFTVRLSSVSAVVVTCSYATSDGSAAAGWDYASSAGTVTFAPGTTSQAISVAIMGDRDVESNESFFVTLSSPANATLAVARSTGTIIDDDSAPVQPVVAVSDAMLVEGDAGMRALTFVVTLSTSTSIAVGVEYETADGTAVAGTDYLAARGSLLFQPGVISQAVEVPILGDIAIESDETFRLVLRAVTGATGTGSHATATIRDDDSGRTAAILPIAGSSGGAGGAFFRTTLQFHNPGEHAMMGNLVIRSIGGGEPRIAPYAVQPHETLDVSAAFGSGFVTVDIAPISGGLPEAVARVFNDAAERGTAGLTTNPASVADAITAGRRGILLAPAQGAAMRLNLGARSLDEGVEVTFALRRASGEVVERVSRALPPNALLHDSAATLFSASLEPNDSIEVSVRTGSAIVYGSSVDNISHDPSFIIAKPLPLP